MIGGKNLGLLARHCSQSIVTQTILDQITKSAIGFSRRKRSNS
jgi:hypothetical protein